MIALGLLIVLLFVIFFGYFMYNNTSDNRCSNCIVLKANPYSTQNCLLWPSSQHTFLKSNFPSNFEFDYEIKNDILQRALKAPRVKGKQYAVIDCGGHIGDGSIPLAHALLMSGREDIVVYCIEPEKYKCDFVKQMKELNNLSNLTVLQYGLSNTESKLYPHANQKNNDIQVTL